MELDDLDERLRGIEGTCGRIDERTKNMQAHHERELRGAYHRIGEVREECRDDVKDVRGELRKTGGTAGSIAGGMVAGIIVAVKSLFGSN